MTIIGDVHGKINDYWKLITTLDKNEQSICVGDFGFKKQHDWLIDDSNIDTALHKINFGNHDYYPYLESKHSCKNWYYYTNYKLMTIRGAKSIDTWHRTEGIDWFTNEELSYLEGKNILNIYETIKPEIVVSHDCPQSIKQSIFGYTDLSITSTILEECLIIHKPKLWIFGHHHQSINTVINNTNFICLDELETYKI